MDRKSQHKDIFKKKAKTFYFASFFLGQKTIEKVSLLYAFCRFIDDIADETHDPHNAQKELEKIKDEISINLLLILRNLKNLIYEKNYQWQNV